MRFFFSPNRISCSLWPQLGPYPIMVLNLIDCTGCMVEFFVTPWTEDPVDCILPGSSVHWILQVSILEWVTISFFSRSSWPRDWTHVSCVPRIGRQILYHCTTLPCCMSAKSLQSCLTLCDPVDCSLPGFSVHGIFQARILEWAAMPNYHWNWVINDLNYLKVYSFIHL